MSVGSSWFIKFSFSLFIFCVAILAIIGIGMLKPLFLYIYKVVCLFLVALGLRCCARAFYSCSELAGTLHCGAQPSHCDGFSCCGAQALGTWAQ